MKDVLGQIGAAGAPSLKTEIEFWLKGREEANKNKNYQIAISFYDSAWAESETRGHPNLRVRLDRAVALIALEEYVLAFSDLQAVWEIDAVYHDEISKVINAFPELAYFGTQNAAKYPAMIPFITPIVATEASIVAIQTPVETIAVLSNTTATNKPTIILTDFPTPSDSASETLLASTPAPELPSPFTDWIAYAYGEETQREIFIMNPNTGERRQITSNNMIDESPSFSPDNWMLVYTSNRGTEGWELYAYDLKNSTERKLTTFVGEARFPVWSPVPGDARIVFEGRGGQAGIYSDIWVLDTNTGNMELLTNSGADSRPSWSPDGTQIVFSRATIDTTEDGKITIADNLDVYILDLAKHTETNLTNTPAYDDFRAAWSPDGDWIAFTSVREDINDDGIQNLSDSKDLFIIRKDGTDEKRLDLGAGQVFTPTWSPDGRMILVLVIFGEGQNEIWRVNTNNGYIETITDRGAYYHPSY